MESTTIWDPIRRTFLLVDNLTYWQTILDRLPFNCNNTPNYVNIVSVHKQMDIIVENRAIAINSSPTDYLLN